MFSFACRTVTGAGERILASPPTVAAGIPAMTVTVEPTASPEPSSSPMTTATPPPTLTLTPHPTSAAWQIEVFEELWSVVNEEYLYPDFNGVDWEAVRREYLELVESGLEPEEFYLAMDEMIQLLGDDHSFFLDPTQVVEENSELAGELEYVGVGILITTEPDRERAIVLLTFPDSPAERAGLRSRDIILAVDGAEVTGREFNLGQLIRGPEGTEITLTVKSPGEEPRDVQMVRGVVSGPLQVPYHALETESGKRIGYILVPTFSDGTISGQVGNAIAAMSAEGPLEGIIIDNRWNNGGVDTMLRGTLSFFVGGLAGYFVNNEGARAFTVNPDDIAGSQDVDLVVLIGRDTVSFGEIFAGILSDLGRAYIIGELTGGNVETLWGYDFSDGSRAWIAHDTFRPLNNPDLDWEQNGIVPDESVLAAWEEYQLEHDPVVRAALAHFDR
ncbi:MAG: S41 family peptidase [Anaerolineales bacterium]|nr:S41 family peptidase [Anaerolineales bacterium]